MNPGFYITIDEVVTQYQIDWFFSQGADSGNMMISVNGSTVVYATSNGGNSFMVNPGDYINVYVTSFASSYLISEAGLTVYDSVDGTLYSNISSGMPIAYESYGAYYPSGNGEINGSAYQY